MRNIVCTLKQNKTLHLGALFLLFSRITLMLCVALLANASDGPTAILQSSSTAGGHESSQEELSWTSAGEARASDGTFLGVYVYKNKKGISVSLTKGIFKSPTAAQKELSLWLKTAKKIIEQSLMKSATGEAIGKRAVASFSDLKPHDEYFAIMWTNGPKCYWVSSSSLNLARDLENQIKYARKSLKPLCCFNAGTR